MQKFALMLASCLVCSSLVAAESPAAKARGTALEAQYEALTAVSGDAQKELYRTLSIEDRQAVWSLHLARFLAERRELSPEARSVIFEGLGLLSGGLFERLRSTDAAVVEQAKADLEQLKIRGRAAMPLELAIAAFGRLDGNNMQHSGDVDAPDHDASRLRVRANIIPYCSCNVGSDFCSYGYCIYTPRSCIFTPDGCGWMWIEGCNGQCS